MEGKTPHRKRLSLKDRQRLQASAKYLLLKEGYNQPQTAKFIGVSTKTICDWVKEHGWADDIEKLSKSKAVRLLRLDDSLSAFISYARIHNPELYDQLIPTYNQFIQPL